MESPAVQTDAPAYSLTQLSLTIQSLTIPILITNPVSSCLCENKNRVLQQSKS